ncbi:MAG TPA: glycosyltransferase family 1 protein [Candidatus Saccharimonadales bacterium]|nr:glycosyltransferase family 1 protein [Candidatus Saccharimonadales bacterium]
MSKIVIDAREMGTSSGRYVEQLLKHLQIIDAQNNYVILLKPKLISRWQSTNQNFKSEASPHQEFTYDEQFGLMKQIKALKADLVHFPMVQQPAWYGGKTVTTMNDLTTLRYTNPSKNPIIFSFKQKVYKWLNRRVAKKSQAIITFSEFVKNDLVKFTGINSAKINIINLAADPITDSAEPLGKLKDKQFLMYVGRPTPHKNLERLIEAFAKIKVSQPELFLVFVGKQDANYRRIVELVKKQGIKDVVFTDWISDGQLRWLYENCAAYVFPSLSEGFGLPGLEAMAHGAPVVSSKATCLPEIYGEAAHYFDPLNVDDMAKSINEVLTNQDLRDSLIQKGHTQVKKYSWRRMAEQTLAIYNQVLRKN